MFVAGRESGFVAVAVTKCFFFIDEGKTSSRRGWFELLEADKIKQNTVETRELNG